MDVTLAVLADYSNVSREGKLNILGIFDTIYSRVFPFTWPNMQLVMRFEAPYSEVGTQQNVRVRLLNADGVQILEVGGIIALSGGRSGEVLVRNHILTLNNITFPAAGDYSFNILINDRADEHPVVLKVLSAPQQQIQPPQIPR